MSRTLDVAFRESDLIPFGQSDRLTIKSSYVPDARVSIGVDGSIGYQMNDADPGPRELAYRRGDKVFWISDQYNPPGVYVALIAVGL